MAKKVHTNPYKEHKITPEMEILMDDEAKVFQKEFMPLYIKFSGTKQLKKHLLHYIATHDIKRKDDFRGQLAMMWIEHIIEYRRLNNIPFSAEDIYKIKIPQEILNIK